MSQQEKYIRKMMSYLPDQSNFISMEEYNEMYKTMVNIQSNDKGEELPQKEAITESHKELRHNLMKSKLSALQTIRKRNKK
jgi:alpha-D-ribose 1-methylphosphonate 5-triphosphate diphosphatase PhnM